MKDNLPLHGCARKRPCQQRGQDRVSALLAAAVAEFAAEGYEAATMSAVAKRAKASIGSLYQFFPNKEAVARALRTRQINDAEALWRAEAEGIAVGDVKGFVDRFVPRMTEFADGHPAFLLLLDAPSSTLPVGPRNRLRQMMARMLRSLKPELSGDDSDRVAESILLINKSFLGLYARSESRHRAWVSSEYSEVLIGYLQRRLGSEVAARRGGGLAAGRTKMRRGAGKGQGG